MNEIVVLLIFMTFYDILLNYFINCTGKIILLKYRFQNDFV